MNKETIELINKLAAKLGTTSEYLWSVLLKQAYISGTTDVIFYIGTIIMAIIMIVLHLRFKKSYTYENDGVEFIMFIGGVMLIIILIVEFFSIGNTITAFFHPEYWALSKILESLKN